jgi:hypothetical protein
VNLGLRYELAMPWYEIHNDFSDFILQPGPAYGLLVTAPDASHVRLKKLVCHTGHQELRAARRTGLSTDA